MRKEDAKKIAKGVADLGGDVSVQIEEVEETAPGDRFRSFRPGGCRVSVFVVEIFSDLQAEGAHAAVVTAVDPAKMR